MKTKITTRVAHYARNVRTTEWEVVEANECPTVRTKTVETQSGNALTYVVEVTGEQSNVNQFVVEFPLLSAEIVEVGTGFAKLAYSL